MTLLIERLSMPHSHATTAATPSIRDLDTECGLLIGGRWQRAATTFEVDDPATGDCIAAVSDGTPEDARSAVDAADVAFARWRTTSPRARSEVLHRAFALMHERQDMLVELIKLENGKPEADARGEVRYAAEFFRWFAEEAVRSSGTFGESPAGGTRTIVTHRPVGVAALVTPWNFPAAMATRKIAPALAAGCTVVLKPAAETPLTALAVARLLTDAGVPHGVVNVVPTTDAPGVVSTWLADPRVRKLSFTGSTPVGRVLLHQAASRVVNASMELGGNAPFIVTADADLEAAVEAVMVAKFRNGGQACTAANRLLVHQDVVDGFTELLGTAVSQLVVGPASAPETAIGPMISAGAAARIRRAVESAVAGGARITHQAALPAGATGHFVAPVVLRDVAPNASIVTEEVFGPIAPIVTFATDSDAVRIANSSEFGLAAYVHSRDLQQALRLAEALDAGMVGVNRGLVSDPAAPFGGVKQSGLGREGAREGMLEFTETKFVSVAWPEAAMENPG